VKYLLLLNNDAREWQAWRELSPDEAERLRAEEVPRWTAAMGWMAEQGIEATGLELEDPAQARVVRVRDGGPIVTDGPFAETKEVLGGYFLVECKDLDQAIELAQRIPLADKGSVEIRPLADQ
jgi:hypothetical protein